MEGNSKGKSKQEDARNDRVQPSTQEPAPLPPTFGKSALVTLFVAMFIYGYQTGLFTSWISKFLPALGEEPFVETVFSKVVIEADIPRRDAVVQAFKHAWNAYEQHAMGCDEYHPLTRKGSNLTDSGGIGYTIIDAIDTIWLMGLDDEYSRARDWIDAELTFDRHGNYNTFETTIRVLGGLLSAYHFSSDPLFLSKATDLANRMLPVFDTQTGIPLSMINLGKGEGVDDPNMPGLVSTAEASTLQLEFKYLSTLTENTEYWDNVERVMKVINNAIATLGLAPIYLDGRSGQFMTSEVRLGSRGDSFYEYLLKQYLQTNKTEPMYLEMYRNSMQAIHKTLVQKGSVQGLTFTAELLPMRSPNSGVEWRLSLKQDHLVCFLAGSLMLGATTTGMRGLHVSRPPKDGELNNVAWEDWALGEEILRTCLDTHRTATGLSPEIVYFYEPEEVAESGHTKEKDWYIKNNDNPTFPSYDARYILRPETIESLFIAYRLTGNATYREEGWRIFEAIEKYCKIEDGGYSGILNVDDKNSERLDKMESFFLSETLKYLYLLFSDDSILPLDRYVFNTEAHPLPIFTPTGAERGFFGYR